MVCWARWGKLARFKDSWFMLVLWGGWGDHGKGDFSCRGDRRHQETGANDFEYNRTRLLGQSHKKDSFGVESPLIHDHPWSSMTYLHWKPLCFPHSGEREQRLFDKLPLECKEDQKSLECPGHYLTIRTVRMLPGTLQITSDYQSLRAKGRLNACCIKSASRVMLVHWCTTWKWLDRPRTAPVNSVSMGETRWNMLKPFSQIRGWQSYRSAQTKTSLWSRFIMECSKQCDRRSAASNATGGKIDCTLEFSGIL